MATTDRPQLSRLRGGYMLRWNNIVMEVRQLKRRDDDWRCELLIGLETDGDIELLWTGHHNLMAARSRSLLAKDLADRIEYAPWGEMLQQLTFLVVEAERRGEPMINLADYAAPLELRYLMRGWIMPGKPTALFGLGGSGKTWLGIMIAHALATGQRLLGYDVPTAIKVGIFDYENDPDTTWLRLAKVAQVGAKPSIFYRQLTLPLTEYEEQIAHDVETHNLQFAVLDSFALASGGSQQKDDLVIPVYAVLRRLGIATLLIDHEAKSSNGEYAIGTVYKHNLARITWHLKATKENTETGDLYLLASNRKNNEDRREKPLGIHMMFGPKAVGVKRLDPADLPTDLQDDVPLRDRIAAELKGGQAMSTGELAELLGEKAADIRARLNDMERKGEVWRREQGRGRGNSSTWQLRSDRHEYD